VIRASILLLLAAPAWGEPALVFDRPTRSVCVTGVAPDVLAAVKEQSLAASALTRAFAVYFEDATTAMLGDYQVHGNALRFTPRFPFLPGRAHRAIFDPLALAEILGLPERPASGVQRLSFRIDEPERRSATRVTAVYPSGDVVPANLLRIYIVFSQPMSRRGIEHHIQLLGENGEPVEHPFLDMEDGLWDPGSRRLTLILDPGRIKRGLALNELKGLPLRSGGRYRLVVSADASDAEGSPLAENFSKEYRVEPADRTSPDPRKWKVTIPRAGTRELLVVAADKALDQPLFERLVRVEDATGSPLEGEGTVEDGGTQWRFVPAEAWRPGQYRLRVAAELEDLAGNRPTRLFDQPMDTNGIRRQARDVVLPLQIPK
jgi:hypothetical protein